VFTRVYQTLRDTGTLPGVRIAAECDVNEGVNEEEGIVQTVQSSPRASTRRIARRLCIPHKRVITVESNFRLRFSVNLSCAVLDNQLIGPFILEGRITGEAYLRFLQEELPRLLEDVHLNKQGRLYFQHDGVPPHFSHGV